MGKIKQLPPEIAQQIAAGEVVERPANIVKELLENALDAGATQITVWIEDGGKQLIRIRDNGCGMSADDAQLCFSAHATSKLQTVEDIQTVSTYGFRGEALASISSVARVVLQTKEPESIEGFSVTIEGGIIKETGVAACPVGTEIVIRDLFYQIPARKKFLKKAASEVRHIQQLFYANCFQFLGVHFTLFSEGKKIYNCPPVKTVADRWAQLHDHEQAQSMLCLKEHTYQNITVTGLISNHQVLKYDRSHIYVFVNRRWIKNHELMRSLIRGYQNVLPNGKFPAAILNIEIDPLEVDSNIHPRKEEVKFLHPRRVEQQVTLAVKKTLENTVSEQITNVPSFNSFMKHEYGTSFSNPYLFTPTHSNPTPKPIFEVKNRDSISSVQPQSFDFDRFFNVQTTPFEKDFIVSKNDTPQDVQSIVHKNTTDEETPERYRFIGNYNKTYILAEYDNKLVLIDQHAAHERILYEKFATRFENIAQIKLMFPQMINGKKEDLDLLEEHLQLFTDNNFALERFDEQNLVLTATPVHAKNINVTELVQEAISWIKESSALPQEELYKKIHHNLRAQMACKAAVKAGDTLSEEQMKELLSDLSTCDNRLTCPHGRPTTLSFELYEIEKKFKRRL